MTIESFLRLLHNVRKSGDGWKALCPGHEDKSPSLSITMRDGKILLNCFANCTAEAICAALKIKVSDLFATNGHRHIVCAYDYTDEKGKLLYQNVRYEPKDFRMRRKAGNGWVDNLNGVRRVPYHLPAIDSANFVLIVEGEKDADAASTLGLAATSSKHWRPEFSEFFRDKRVAIIADADDAGRKIAGDVGKSLTGKTASLKVIELPGAKDLSDWIAAGGKKDALFGFIDTHKEWNNSWREMFHSFSDFESAPPLSFAIANFLQNDGATIIGGLSGHGKTLVMLSLAKALLTGKGAKLWNYFEVLETASRVIYLIPESSIGPFKYRIKLFGLYDYLRDDRLLVRTLSLGPTPCLSDPRILVAAKGAHVVLDTAVRFSTEGDENSAGDNQRGLASDIFALLGAGARTVIGAHHSPKSFAKESGMTLENVLRGSGDIGAMVATAWGIKQLDAEQNIVHVENIKPRDFQPPAPFQIVGRPYIDNEGSFRMHKKPGECGALMEEGAGSRQGGGAPILAREHRAASIQLLRAWLAEDPRQTSEELMARFANAGIKLARSTIRKYKMELEGLQ